MSICNSVTAITGCQEKRPAPNMLEFIAKEYKRIMDGIEGQIEIEFFSQKTIAVNGYGARILKEVGFSMPIIKFMKKKPKYKDRPYPCDNEKEKSKILKTEFYNAYGDNVVAELDFNLKMQSIEQKVLNGRTWEGIFFGWRTAHRQYEMERKRKYEDVKKCKHGYYREDDYMIKIFETEFTDKEDLSKFIESEATRYSTLN